MARNSYEGIQNAHGRRGQPSEIVFRYNGDPRTDERVVADRDGIEEALAPGRRIKRRGKQWHIVAANRDFAFIGGVTVIILRVFLGDCI